MPGWCGGNFVYKYIIMTHQYTISGMTCGGCEAKVKSSLLVVPHVTAVTVSRETASAEISMEKHIPLPVFQAALGEKYTISEDGGHSMQADAEPVAGWFATYKPILLLFSMITLVAGMVSFTGNGFDLQQFMRIFMAGFFLSFSFFKLLDLPEFADSYSTYDIIARKWRGWGFAYAGIELALGVAYTLDLAPVLVNSVTLLVMGISIIGVLQSILNKRKIRCACLGAVFNLPMSTVTIIEDALMIAMSGMMLVMLF